MTQELSDVADSEPSNDGELRLFDPEKDFFTYRGKNRFVAAGNFVLDEFNRNLESFKNPDPNYHSIIGFVAEAIKYPVLIFTSGVLALPMYLGGVCMLEDNGDGRYRF